jgi:hypothetical protein
LIKGVALSRQVKAQMMLASIEPAHAGLDLHTFECAI